MPLLLFCRFCVNFTGRINSPCFLRVFFFQKQQLKSHFSGYLFLRTPLDDCFCSFKLHNNRSSSLEVFYKKRFPKNFTKFSTTGVFLRILQFFLRALIVQNGCFQSNYSTTSHISSQSFLRASFNEGYKRVQLHVLYKL